MVIVCLLRTQMCVGSTGFRTANAGQPRKFASALPVLIAAVAKIHSPWSLKSLYRSPFKEAGS